MQEIWKDVKGYEGLYQVSNLGRVKNKIRNKCLKPNKTTWGYYGVALYKNGISKRFQVHRLVAIAFIDNLMDKKEVNHKDGNKLNNCVENLEWCTRSENMKHSFTMGLEKPPMKNKTGRLNSRSKAVIQMDLENNYLRKFESMGEVARYLKNKSADRTVSKCCNGLRKTAYGFIWRFENEL